jgi:mannose-1-phosphate guanylyltransferase/mannose-6-phosphate isomerase
MTTDGEDMRRTQRIVPVILSGGAGTRLWPASREAFPKQFLPLIGTRSTFEETLMRVADPAVFEPPVVVTGERFRFLVADQFERAGMTGRIVLEPARRDSAPAIAVAAALALTDNPGAILLVLAADHLVGDAAAFVRTAVAGLAAAALGHIVTFGIVPDRPATGYGYIRPGDALDGPVRHVAAFVEKPSADRARDLIAQGCLWNSGNFLFRADVLLAELETFEPAIASAARRAAAMVVTDPQAGFSFERIGRDAFEASPAKSIDFAVMERTRRAAVIPAAYAWSDLGSFEALWEVAERDESDNATRGPVTLAGTSASFVTSDGPHVAVIGLDAVAVVATPDAVLVAPRGIAAELKPVVSRLADAAATRRLTDEPVRTIRPWGLQETLRSGERSLVRRIVVRPGGSVSRQLHRLRAEHWVVVSGIATIDIGDETRIVRENESLFVPRGTLHRLANAGGADLEIIEVQTGESFADDDVLRGDGSNPAEGTGAGQ